MSDLIFLKGLGPKTIRWLAEVGIESEADLRAIGAVAAYHRLKQWAPRLVTKNALWGLHAALNGIDWRQLDDATKEALLREVGNI